MREDVEDVLLLLKRTDGMSYATVQRRHLVVRSFSPRLYFLHQKFTNITIYLSVIIQLGSKHIKISSQQKPTNLESLAL